MDSRRTSGKRNRARDCLHSEGPTSDGRRSNFLRHQMRVCGAVQARQLRLRLPGRDRERRPRTGGSGSLAVLARLAHC